jgi:Ion channel
MMVGINHRKSLSMFVTPSILFLLSPDVTPFAVLGFGCLMLVAITLFHGVGLDRIVSLYKGKSQKCLQSPWHPLMAQYFFGWTILLLLLLHLVDTTIWALVLNLTDLVPNIHESFYFSANTYTTLGYGNVPLPHAWRQLRKAAKAEMEALRRQEHEQEKKLGRVPPPSDQDKEHS